VGCLAAGPWRPGADPRWDPCQRLPDRERERTSGVRGRSAGDAGPQTRLAPGGASM